jgi:type IV pilus assembly protein PilA
MVKRDNENGFTLIELLIVVSIIGVIASIGVAQLMRARLVANETTAIGSLRTVNSGQTNYASAAGQGGYATNLTILATPCAGSPPFVSPDLNPSAPGVTAVGTGVLKSGYVIDLVATGAAGPNDCSGLPTTAAYSATAAPRTLGASGERGFNTSANGSILWASGGLTNGTAPIQ